MIAESEGFIKVQERKLELPFRLHPYCGCVFAPWGKFGATYQVSTEAEYQFLNERFPSIQSFCCIGLMYAWMWAVPLFGTEMHLNLVGYCLVNIASCLLFGFIRSVRIKIATRNLSIIESRHPFFPTVRNYMHSKTPANLWFMNLLSLASVAVLRLIARHTTHDFREYLLYLELIFVLLALIISLLISLRALTPVKKGHQVDDSPN